jgi:uncharacterized RDD family membrane protein YckC
MSDAPGDGVEERTWSGARVGIVTVAPSDRVCPECGEPAGTRPFCGVCGVNLAQAERLPSREEWEAAVPPERDGRIFAPPTNAPVYRPTTDPSFEGRPMANWGYRVGAFLVDVSLIILAGLAIGFLAGLAGAGSDDAAGIVGLAVIALWITNSAVIVALTGGQSVGKWVAGTRIVRENGRPVGFGTGLVRDSLCRLLFFIPLVFLIDSLMPLGDKRQSLRDKIVGTRVLQEPEYRSRRWPLAGAALVLTGAWIALSAASGAWDSNTTYDALDRDAFVSGCSEEGTSEAECGCAFDQIKAQLPYDDYQDANRTSDPDEWQPHTRRVIVDAMSSCTD